MEWKSPSCEYQVGRDSVGKLSKTAKQLLDEKHSDLKGVITVAPGDSVLSALKVMADKNVGALVISRDGKIVGILSERDYARKVELVGKNAASTRVSDIMTEKVFSAGPADSIDRCRTLMSQHRVRHLPICENGRAVGILSMRDVLEEIIREEEKVIRGLETDRLIMTTNTGVY
jgi:CBS domain-containing protein